MALVLKDRVRETSTTTGTGTFTLAGAVAGFQSFSAIGTGNSTYYTIVSTSDWEVGIGTWTSPDQLSRDTVLASTNAGALVTFGSGTKDVFLTFPAEGFAVPPAIGGTTPNTITGTTVSATTQITLPTVTVGNTGFGVLQMVDGLDGFDYLEIYSDDGGGLQQTVFFPGGIYTPIIGGVNAYVANAIGATVGSLLLWDANNTNSVKIQPPSALSATYTLTLPTTAGSNNQVLKTDGSGNLSWLDFGSPPAIGSTTPNTGAFTTLSTTGATTTTAVSDPSAPANGNLSVYAKQFGGYTTLAARNALNKSFGLQSALWSKSIQMWTNTSATAGSWLNSVGGSNGTFTAVVPTVGGTLYQTIRRSTYANVITTTNQILGVSNNYLCFFRGSTAGQGGFFFHARLGFDVWTNGGRFFAGLAAGTNIVTADPSTRNDVCGFAVDAADNGAISFLTRNTVSATKASTGYTITSNKGYDVYFYCSSNGASIGWMIVDINAGTSASGSATLTLPTATVANTSVVLASNAALTPATSISLGIAKIYTETDY